jgi:beta-glucosidase
VTNTGDRAGWAVPQVYVGLESRRHRPEPPQQLAGFAKVHLSPGQSRRVTIPLDPRAFQYWDVRTHRFREAPLGCQTITVGTSSRDSRFGVGVCADG